ncbi:MAG: hypothetical protein QN120_12515 [Armatimonadota bacterium]|nr:hypothetical protein [Armatimonadota bacterium]
MTPFSRAALCVVALSVILAAGGAARAGPAPSLFPLPVGAEWVRVNDDGTESISRVVGTKMIKERRCTVVERRTTGRERERTTRTCYLVTASDVLVLETTNPRGELVVLNPPRVALRLPPRAGLSWSWSPADVPFAFKVAEKWIGEETVRVKAGTFRAWKLQSITTGEDSEITAFTWYAPGVGAVRTERKGHRGDRQISGWSELVRYKIP